MNKDSDLVGKLCKWKEQYECRFILKSPLSKELEAGLLYACKTKDITLLPVKLFLIYGDFFGIGGTHKTIQTYQSCYDVILTDRLTGKQSQIMILEDWLEKLEY